MKKRTQTPSRSGLYTMKRLIFLILCAVPAVYAEAQSNMAIYEKNQRDLLYSLFQSEEMQNKIGTAFYYGESGFTENKASAVRWFRKCAERKVLPPYILPPYNLAVCYYFGEGVTQRKDSAVHYFHSAAKSGLAEAQYNLSLCYFFGEGVARDTAQAALWYRKAIKKKKGLPEMQSWTIQAGQHGGDPKSLFKQMIRKESRILEAADVQNAIGEYYYRGTSNFPKDFKMALYWFRRSINQMEGRAMYNLGYCFYFGDGVALDKDSATHYFKLAAEMGVIDAQCDLALCYFFGDGVEKNNELVAYWYQKAARSEYPLPCNNLGYCYEFGIGTTQDLKQAERYYKIAAEQDYAHAQYNLAALYAEEDTSSSQRKARNWLQRAAEQGYIPAIEAMNAIKKGNKSTYIPKGLRYGFEKAP